MQGITKRFGAVTALHHVNLDVKLGTVHAVVGENGAGKTTLMNILYGAFPFDSGTMQVLERTVQFKTSKDAIHAGIGMVSQHYGIIGALNCLENLVLGAEGGAWLDRGRALKRAQELADAMGFEFDWDAEASGLSPAAAQKLEILKLLWRNAKIMILDEPTAMLSPSDSDALFRNLRVLVDRGATVLLVTHRLPEVLDHCESVTVLRGGRFVTTKAVSNTDARELASLIVGETLDETASRQATRSKTEDRPQVLSVTELDVKNPDGVALLKQASLTVGPGEIVGIAGVDGSGQRELIGAILGTQKTASGSIIMQGEALGRKNVAKRLAAGMRIIPEDRHSQAVVGSWSLEENSGLGLQREPFLRTGGWVNRAARLVWSEKVAQRFSTRHGGLNLPLDSLSGGNQQRFVAARAIESNPRLLLCFQPARGLDLKATAAVYGGVRAACEAGAGALVVSFDLDELLEHCDRILVMNGGQVLEPPKGKERDRETIGRLMVGAN